LPKAAYLNPPGREHLPQRCLDLGDSRSVCAGEIPHPVCLLFGAGFRCCCLAASAGSSRA
jgi:hypothetical protein